jgi:hypothetical protein
MLALSALIRTASGLLGRLSVYCAQFLAGIEEARAMALAYQNLANLSDRDLAARGLHARRHSARRARRVQ